jgi:hypothetical protein
MQARNRHIGNVKADDDEFPIILDPEIVAHQNVLLGDSHSLLILESRVKPIWTHLQVHLLYALRQYQKVIFRFPLF